MRGLVGLASAVVLGVFGWVAFHIVPASGLFANLKPKLIDQCRTVKVFPGTEDVTVDTQSGIAFISADDRRASAAGAPVQGGIYALRLDGTDRVSKVSPDSFGEFHPHGLSLWRAPDGKKRLFVINHTANEGDKVELFDVGFGGALFHVGTVQFDAMTSANDVLGVGPRSFYVTNDHGFNDGSMALVESYLALPLASLAYYDGQSGRVVARGLSYANGVNMSADGSEVYVAGLISRDVTVFDRDAGTGSLTRVKSIRVNTAPDNIEIASDGALWIGGHPKVFDFLKYAKDPAAISPSQVIRVNPQSGVADDVFLDAGGTINGSSVGAVSEDALIVGSVFDDHVVVCPFN